MDNEDRLIVPVPPNMKKTTNWDLNLSALGIKLMSVNVCFSMNVNLKSQTVTV